MTFSILAHDQKTGTYAAAAATGSLCVGGWVIRGDIERGLSASQGTAPSTFWRDEAIRLMGQGVSAGDAVFAVTQGDAGRGHRQLITLDAAGRAGGFTGGKSVPAAAHRCFGGLAVAGNMLSSEAVLDALVARFRDGEGEDMAERLLASLRAAERAGGDSRGLLSAALLVLRPDAPPLDLRIDRSDRPLDDLGALLQAARTPPYADWLDEVPVLTDKSRAPV
ncbi:DUF1028 domain-containing protein [Nioella sediminis]|uniref:DUF1028 domain-containing protein n=1 Tax=Nioella sediminis TaxID=1912092 RepID=UPI0008FD772A|nr:DUF1028 domain-containing protein [Nioella sediminis]TBX23019.1 major pilin protein fimA [Roseovarius sp. JS7-11]